MCSQIFNTKNYIFSKMLTWGVFKFRKFQLRYSYKIDSHKKESIVEIMMACQYPRVLFRFSFVLLPDFKSNRRTHKAFRQLLCDRETHLAKEVGVPAVLLQFILSATLINQVLTFKITLSMTWSILLFIVEIKIFPLNVFEQVLF